MYSLRSPAASSASAMGSHRFAVSLICKGAQIVGHGGGLPGVILAKPSVKSQQQ